jgi:hypothetical protein
LCENFFELGRLEGGICSEGRYVAGTFGGRTFQVLWLGDGTLCTGAKVNVHFEVYGII